MFPVLRSIDNLLNRFDELSQRHASLVSNFDTNFTDIENPLHNVTRDEDEQQKTIENLLKADMEDNDQLGSVGTMDDFNRRNIKSRCQNRPPSYSSNDSSLLFHRFPSRSSWTTTQSAPPLQTSIINRTQSTIKTSNSQTAASTSIENLIESKPRFITKNKPNVLSQNPSPIRRNARSAITTFTLETAIRLSRPRTSHHSSEQKISPKRVHRRPRPFQTKMTEASITSVPLPPPQSAPAHIKRTNPTIIKSSPKKLKAENKYVNDNSKRIPMSNYPHPAIYLAPPPTICLTFPMQPELKSSRAVVIPKANPITAIPAKRAVNIFTNRRSIIPPNRMIYLMT